MMEALPLVTIAIPTYNRANGYLREAIRCALQQTYRHIEVLIADNCSNDNTKEIVRNCRDDRIRYYRHEKNIGANNNFNFCLEHARGAYFLLFHDDDRVDQDFVETCMKAADFGTEAGIIRTGTRIIDADGNVVRERPNMVEELPTLDFFRGWFSGKTVLFLCSTLFNTQRLREIGGFRSKHNLFQDVAAEVQMAARFGRVDVRYVKASFRKHSMEMTYSVKVSHWCEDSLELLDLMCTLVPGEWKGRIREEGMHFFSKINYDRAGKVKSPVKRFQAYFTVFKKFGYRYPPSKGAVTSQLTGILREMPAYPYLRALKRAAERISGLKV